MIEHPYSLARVSFVMILAPGFSLSSSYFRLFFYFFVLFLRCSFPLSIYLTFFSLLLFAISTFPLPSSLIYHHLPFLPHPFYFLFCSSFRSFCYAMLLFILFLCSYHFFYLIRLPYASNQSEINAMNEN